MLSFCNKIIEGPIGTFYHLFETIWNFEDKRSRNGSKKLDFSF